MALEQVSLEFRPWVDRPSLAPSVDTFALLAVKVVPLVQQFWPHWQCTSSSSSSFDPSSLLAERLWSWLPGTLEEPWELAPRASASGWWPQLYHLCHRRSSSSLSMGPAVQRLQQELLCTLFARWRQLGHRKFSSLFPSCTRCPGRWAKSPWPSWPGATYCLMASWLGPLWLSHRWIFTFPQSSHIRVRWMLADRCDCHCNWSPSIVERECQLSLRVTWVSLEVWQGCFFHCQLSLNYELLFTCKSHSHPFPLHKLSYTLVGHACQLRVLDTAARTWA